ncbi:MAG TPA: hypothetical protein VLO11_04585 [Luteolibacter sp.]|nr:hypothetical protein [Luteolibacter sp.]
MKRIIHLTAIVATIMMAWVSPVRAQDGGTGEAEIMAEPVPPGVKASAVAAVGKLGDEVVLGRYQAALDRMNPEWKQRTAARMGGMAELERRLEGVAAEMIRQGITMISFKPQGEPVVHEVSPGTKKVRENGVEKERMVFTKWLVLVPTVTRFRIIAEGNPRPMVIENTGFQVAVADKDKLDWSFIDGSGLTTADLRGLFITLPKDMELPPVGKREVR